MKSDRFDAENFRFYIGEWHRMSTLCISGLRVRKVEGCGWKNLERLLKVIKEGEGSGVPRTKFFYLHPCVKG
jgi:hypothetical protein